MFIWPISQLRYLWAHYKVKGILNLTRVAQHATIYAMIKSWKHKGLKKFYETGSKSGIVPEHAIRLKILLQLLNAASTPECMNAPGFDYHGLKGNLGFRRKPHQFSVNYLFIKKDSTGVIMISFKYRHFDKAIILMAVRWYVAYSLSYRDIEELFLERNIVVDHSTINRWVVKYSPQLLMVFKKSKKQVGYSWRADETYVKVKGEWFYQYRAVDKDGKTIDVYFSKKRDKTAAKRFFKKAIGSSGQPEKITIDKSSSNLSALNTLNESCSSTEKFCIRQIKYLNNIVEQDHRFVKKIIKPMMGFQTFESANATLQGVELHHMLRKNQHEYSDQKTVPELFYALAAQLQLRKLQLDILFIKIIAATEPLMHG